MQSSSGLYHEMESEASKGRPCILYGASRRRWNEITKYEVTFTIPSKEHHVISRICKNLCQPLQVQYRLKMQIHKSVHANELFNTAVDNQVSKYSTQKKKKGKANQPLLFQTPTTSLNTLPLNSMNAAIPPLCCLHF